MLKEFIELAGGLRKAAERLGVAPSYLSMVLKGQRSLNPELEARIKETLQARGPSGLSLGQALDEFLFSKEAEGISAKTLEFYRQKLRPFIGYLQNTGVKVVKDITPAHIRDFMMALRDTGHGRGGLHAYYRAIRAFMAYLEGEGIIDQSPHRKVKAPRLPKRVMPTLSPEQLQRLFSSRLGDTEFTEKRNRALLLVLLDTGVRLGELLSMRLTDLDLRQGMVKVSGKTGERLVGMSEGTVSALKSYLELRRDTRNEVWLNDDGSPMTQWGIEDLFRRLKQKFPDMKHLLHPHAFRHTCATRLLEAGMDIRLVQRHIGHASITMTQHYTGSLRDEVVIKAHRRLSPVKLINGGEGNEEG